MIVKGEPVTSPFRSTGNTVEVLSLVIFSMLRKKSHPERVNIVQAVTAVTLQSIHKTASENIRCDPVENEVADGVRRKMDACVTADIRELVIKGRPYGALQGQDSIAVVLVLPLVQHGRVKAVQVHPGQVARIGGLSRIVWNFKPAIVAAEHQA